MPDERDELRYLSPREAESSRSLDETDCKAESTPEVAQTREHVADVAAKRSTEETTRTQRARERARQTKDKAKEKAKQTVRDRTPEKLKNPTDLQVRFRTGLVYFILSVVMVLINNVTTMIYLAVLAAICAGEFYYMMRSDAKLPNETIGIVGAVAYPVSAWWLGLDGALIVSVALMLALLVWFVFWFRARIPDVGVSFFGAAYTGLLLCGFMITRQALPEPWGGLLVLCIFISVWLNDVMAYFVGSRFGRHRLAPRISPKKSWEGFFGGIFGSAIAWISISFIPGVTLSIPLALVFGCVCGCMSVIGDLAESRIKRGVGVKDSGTIMPGHGGLLDRCDSLFLASVTSSMLLMGAGCIPPMW